MKKSKAYDFIFLGGVENNYVFITLQNLTYEVKFKPSGYLFSDEHPFTDSVYELVLLPIKSEPASKTPTDARIPATMNAIVRHFFKNRGLCCCISVKTEMGAVTPVTGSSNNGLSCTDCIPTSSSTLK